MFCDCGEKTWDHSKYSDTTHSLLNNFLEAEISSSLASKAWKFIIHVQMHEQLRLCFGLCSRVGCEGITPSKLVTYLIIVCDHFLFPICRSIIYAAPPVWSGQSGGLKHFYFYFQQTKKSKYTKFILELNGLAFKWNFHRLPSACTFIETIRNIVKSWWKWCLMIELWLRRI